MSSAAPAAGGIWPRFRHHRANHADVSVIGCLWFGAAPNHSGVPVASVRAAIHNGSTILPVAPTNKGPAMPRHLSRRQFLGSSAALAALGYVVSHLPAEESKSPSERLNIAAVGVANKGGHNLEQLASQNIVALCDVDENYLNQSA